MSRKNSNGLLQFFKNDDELFCWSNLSQSITGLPCIVWIGIKYDDRKPVIIVQDNYSNSINLKSLFVVTIESEPVISGTNTFVQEDDVKKIIEFVKANHKTLMDYWLGVEKNCIYLIEKLKIGN